jgi:hypothetical protein
MGVSESHRSGRPRDATDSMEFRTLGSTRNLPERIRLRSNLGNALDLFGSTSDLLAARRREERGTFDGAPDGKLHHRHKGTREVRCKKTEMLGLGRRP